MSLRVTLSDGRWLEMRPIWVSDRLAIIDLNRRVKKMQAIDYLAEMAALVDRATEARSWDGTAGDMPEGHLLRIVTDWNKVSEDDAVPPVFGATSRKRSPGRSSAPRTEGQPEPTGP